MIDEASYLGPDVVYLVRSGSHAYGTDTETSDLDVRGVYLPEIHEALHEFPVARTRESRGGEVS